MKNFHAGWYLIYTKPRHEKKVHTRLSEINIKTFLPTRKVLRTWHDRKRYIDEPLFPSYLFIYLKDMQSYYEGIDTDGSLYYVRTGKEMARVSESLVESIKLVTNKAKDLEVSDVRFQAGRRLIIKEGPLTGLECEVVQQNNAQKILLRVELLQRNILLSLAPQQLMELK